MSIAKQEKAYLLLHSRPSGDMMRFQMNHRRIPGSFVPTLLLALVSVCAGAQPSEQQITVTGKLVRMMAIGAESTGWVVELESPADIDGQQVNSIQVSYRKIAKLETLENKRVRATGKLAHRHGVETGEQPILNLSSIKPVMATP
ncbi:MAG TPA: hypothetical protein VEJ45_05240 [Candidatus Acidoferrales bacterium]|nr:hypothetical protein [Candidatus Acidoferrales bacterium]